MEFEHGQKQVPVSLLNEMVFERKFDVALRSSHAPSIVNKLKDNENTTSDILIVREHLKKIGKAPDDLGMNRNIYPAILTKILDYRSNARKFGLERVLHLMAKSYAIQMTSIMAGAQRATRGNVDGYMEDVSYMMNSSREISSLLYGFTVMTRIIDKAARSDTNYAKTSTPRRVLSKIVFQNQYQWRKLGIGFYWARNTCIITIDDDIYVLPRSYMLLIHNKISDLISVLVLSCTYPDSVYGRNCHSQVVDFIRAFKQVASEYGDSFFDISKVLEGLVIGETLIKVEGAQNSSFLQSIAESLLEGVGFDYMTSHLRETIVSCSVPLMHEIACLSKMMGHPFCDMEATAQDMEEKTHEYREINVEFVQLAVRQAKQDFVSSYFSKKKEWPPVRLTNPSRSLLRAREKNVDPTSSSHKMMEGAVRLEDWDAVDILKVEEFNKLENFLPYIKDRTVSLTKSKVLGYYIRRDITSKDINWTETRALLAYLLLPYEKTEHLSYLELYSQSDWEAMSQLLVIRLVPKEKEHKVKARCFGCKPPQERARTIVLGENASAFLHKYSDSEAMTLSELVLARKLYAFRNMGKAYERFKQVIICLDASGWNSRLRSAAVNPIVGEVLDGAYGTTYYEQAHDTYHHMFVYLPDVDRVVYWEGQAGGVEGLDQYVWVYAYINHLKASIGTLGYPFKLLVKGDDARVVILIPPQHLEERSLDDVRLELVGRITELAALFGHKMKLEDSYGSSVYCAFSKNAFINNAEMPQSFRKCQKAYGANNAFMNTLDDYVASAYSNCHSTARVSPSPPGCYLLALWWSLIAILRHDKYKGLTDQEIVALTLIPNVLGGLPIIYLHNFYQRAESDLLSSFFMIYDTCKSYDSEIFQVLDNALQQTILDPHENLEMLCLDPYSLPIFKPNTASSVLRNAVREMIEKKSRNEQIGELFEARRDEFHNTMMRALGTCSIYNPKILNGIHSCSPEGLIAELVAKFETGKSIMDALIAKSNRSSGIRILSRARQADIRLHSFRVSLLRNRLTGSENIRRSSSKCPAEVAQQTRVKLWRKPVEGITQPPVSHMVKIGTLDFFSTSHRANFNHFTAVWEPGRSEIMGHLFSEGSAPAFLGESTSKGLTSPEVRLTTHNVFALKVVKLLELYRWTTITTPIPDNERPLCNLVEAMIKQYTKRPIKDFLPFASARPYGRTIHHHVRANQFRPSIIPNTLQNIYTWCKTDMLSHHVASRSRTHFKFNYHEIRCWIVSVLATRSWMGDPPTRAGSYWAVTTECRYCNEPIEEHTITYKNYPLPGIELLRSFDLAKQAIKSILEEVEVFEPDMFFSPAQDENEITPERACMIICEQIVDHEWTRAINIMDHHAGHLVTMGGLEVLEMWGGTSSTSGVDPGDLRYVPMNILVQSLFPLVLSELSSRFPHLKVTNAEMIITTIPSRAYPWDTLMNRLQAINRLRELQFYVSQISNEKCRVVDSASLYTSQLAVKLYKLWSSGYRVTFELGVCSSKDEDAFKGPFKRRLDCLRRCHLLEWTRDFARSEGYNHTHARYAFYMALVSSARYASFYDTFAFQKDVYGDICTTSCSGINLEVIDIEDIVYDILNDGDPLFTSLLALYKKPPIRADEFAQELLDYEDEALQYLEDINQEVQRIYPRNFVRITKGDILTCKRLIRIYEYEPFTDNTLGMEGGSWDEFDHVRMGGPGVWNIVPFEPHQSVDQILGYIMEELTLITYPIVPVANTLTNTWKRRPVGVGNISSSRMADIFDQMGLEDLGENRYIAAFADGYGGMSQVLSSMVTSSQFIFVTTPTKSSELPLPIALLENDRENNFLTASLDVGRYDLKVMSNMTFLEENYGFVIDICVCDAEIVLPAGQKEGYWDIWRHVSVYFLRNCKPRSLLIIKVYMECTKDIMRLITLLSPNTLRCYLVRSAASSHGGEVFLVAQARETVYMDYSQVVKFPPEACQRAFVRYHQSLVEMAEEDYEENTSMDPVELYSPLMRRLCRTVPCYGWTQLETMLGTSLDQPYLRAKRTEERPDYGSRLYKYIEKHLETYETEFQTRREADPGRLARIRREDLYATRTHLIILAYRIFTLYGFLYSISCLAGHSYLDPEDIWTEYAAIVDKYSAYFPEMIGQERRSHESGEFKVHGQYSMFKAYTQGVRWGVSAVDWGYALD